tara:strand:+ start:1227 stop:1739 length:513 start_codon:yes stop_codon:yes gene_type:complete
MATNLEFIKEASATSASTLSITDCFNANYDVYQVYISKVDITGIDWVEMEYLDTSGNAITNSAYDEAVMEILSYGSFSHGYSENRDEHGRMIRLQDDSDEGAGCLITVFNPFSSSTYTFAISQSSANTDSGMFGSKGAFCYAATDSVAGLKFKMNSQTFDYIEVKVYGVK